MAITRLFLYLDLIFASHGVSCFESKNLIRKRVLFILKIFCHIFMVQHLIGCLVNVVTTGDLRNLHQAFYLLISYLSYLLISFKLTRVVIEITKFGDRFLTAKVKRHLIKIEIYSLIAFIVWFVTYTAIGFGNQTSRAFKNGTENFDQINFWTPTPKDSFISLIAYVATFSLLTVHVTDASVIGSVFVHAYLMFLIYTLKMAFLDYVINKKASLKTFRIIWIEIVTLKNVLEDNLNLIPFLAFVILFQNATAVVTFVYSSDSDAKSVFDKLIYFSFEVGIAIPILSTPFSISFMQKNLRDKFIGVQKKFINDPEVDAEINSLMEEIKSNLDMNLTGYGMFKLDKDLILAFLSSVITFSVLSLQLSQN